MREDAPMTRRTRWPVRLALIVALGGLAACAVAIKPPQYDKYVWPPPPDKARIQLQDVIWGRKDVLAKTGGLERALLGNAPQNPLDWFSKPYGVAFDPQGRLLVTDSILGALFRFDRVSRVADVFGKRGTIGLKTPLGLCVGPDGTAYVADAGLKQVVAYDSTGDLKAVYGRPGELENPVDAELSPDGKRLFVADSKAHKIVIFAVDTAKLLSSFGERGSEGGQFSFPTSLAFTADGNLLVVDQMNARIQALTEGGDPVDQLGGRGVGFGNFVRPKDVAVDEMGFIYATDAAFSNVQIFDADFSLLTFVGQGGTEPGRFQIAAGVAVRKDRFAVVDQLNKRVQVFRFLGPKDAQ